MKILYAIQGTGNGHLSRARDIVPILQKKGNVDLLVSGTQADINLPFEIKYRLHGMSFTFGKKGGVDLLKTYKDVDSRQLLKDIRELPVQDYDIVINDFEPVSAWAAKLKGVKCVSLSHQCAVLAKDAPKPQKTDWVGKNILKFYAPTSAKYGFHFARFGENIYTPVIREEIRKQRVEDKGHFTVYLPAYSDKKIIKTLTLLPEFKWQVFSKKAKEAYRVNNVKIAPINNEQFIQSMATSTGVLCGAGFETPAEALFMGKKLMAVPMKGQYEQQCNAAALKFMGIPVIKNIKPKRVGKIKKWLNDNTHLEVNFPNNTEFIIDKLLEEQLAHNTQNAWSPVPEAGAFNG